MGERSLGTRANFVDIVGAGSIVIGLMIVFSSAAGRRLSALKPFQRASTHRLQVLAAIASNSFRRFID